MPSAFSIPRIYELEMEGAIKAGYYSNKSELVREALRNFFEKKTQLRIAAAVEIYKNGEVTLSKAAEIAGLNSLAFKDLLAERNITIKAPKESKQTIKKGVDLIRAQKKKR
ncbi:hypothetical protein CL622_00960 [archaeon]|nr:hypothetical protein [archaeon]